jgi:hypothetical protein
MAALVPRSPSQLRAIDPKTGGYLPDRGPLTHFHWYGGRVEEGLELATWNTIRAATQAAARIARDNHPWQSETGQLESSVFAAEPEWKGDHIYAIWGAHSPALFLEYGTVKMPPYPFLRPAADRAYKLANFAGGIRHNLHGSADLHSMRGGAYGEGSFFAGGSAGG